MMIILISKYWNQLLCLKTRIRSLFCHHYLCVRGGNNFVFVLGSIITSFLNDFTDEYMYMKISDGNI